MKRIILFGPQPPFYSYGGPVRSLNSLRDSLNHVFNLICISPNYHLNGSKTENSSTDKVIFSSHPFFELFKKMCEPSYKKRISITEAYNYHNKLIKV